jgi:hypothetical protein
VAKPSIRRQLLGPAIDGRVVPTLQDDGQHLGSLVETAVARVRLPEVPA